MLYFAFVRYELEYASVAWNPVTITDPNNLNSYKQNLQMFATIDFSLFSTKCCPYILDLVDLRIPTRTFVTCSSNHFLQLEVFQLKCSM
jgi:hypothetical protein